MGTEGPANPKVSVVVPNYNHARFLEQRLRSVLDQTFTDLELIYLDDVSTDHSAEVFQPFAGDPRVRSHVNDENSGSPFKQWNRGVRLARGQYVWIAEADDYADRRLLETLVPLLDHNPHVGLAYCQSREVDGAGRVGKLASEKFVCCNPRRWEQPYVNDGRDEVAESLIWYCTIPNASAVLVRKSAFEQAGMAAEDFRLAGDYVTWIRLLRVSDVAYTPEPLNFWRCHGGTVRRKQLVDGTALAELYQVLRYIVDEFPVEPETLEKVFFARAHDWLHAALFGRERMALRGNWKVYRAARRTDPRLLGHLARMFYYILKRRRQVRRQAPPMPPVT